MSDPNFIAGLSGMVDLLGRNFTAMTYGAFSAYMAPILSSLLVLYFIFWGFRFWQGRGESSVTAVVFRLLRVVIIFSVATGWGPLQVAVYQTVTAAPIFVSNVMLNNIVDAGSGAMSTGTIERDLYDFYNFALIASVRITAAAATAPAPPPAGAAPALPSKSLAVAVSNTPLDVVLTSPIQAAIVWIGAALFVGFAVFLLLFAKMALWVMLALGPLFIILLLFQTSSRFFIGWVTATVQVMLTPIFLYTFLGFYLISIKRVTLALKFGLDSGGAPMMKDVAPFVLVCFSGLFLLIQVVPFAARIGASSHGLAVRAFESVTMFGRGAAQTMVGQRLASGVATPVSSPSSSGVGFGSETRRGGIADIENADFQDRSAAMNRQRRNR
jgi:type IV secretion system protein VirB6